MIVKTKKIKKNSEINYNSLEKKILSIQFSLDGFSFCIFNAETNELLVYTKYLFDHLIDTPEKLLKAIRQIFLKDEELHTNFTKLIVFHDNELITFVPNTFFDKDNLKHYLKYNNKVLDNDFFMFDTMDKYQMKAVYIPYINVNNFLIDQFGGFTYKHASSILVQSLLDHYASKEQQIFVRIYKSYFKIVITKNRKLLFFNTFFYQNKEDFIYYLLFTLEQLEIEPENASVQFLGDGDEKSKLFQIAYQYVFNVTLFKPNLESFNPDIPENTIREEFELFHSLLN